MMNQTKSEWLTFLDEKVNQMNCSDRSISKLNEIINTELQRESTSENPSSFYLKSLRRTIKDQLEPLNEDKDKPRIRLKSFNKAVKAFQLDIRREIGDLT